MFLDDKPQGTPHTSPGEYETLQPWRKKLLAAAALIEEFGWAREAEDEKGRICVLQAFGRVGWDDDTEEACDRFGEYVGDEHVFIWNDCHARDQEEVVAKLRAVALGG